MKEKTNSHSKNRSLLSDQTVMTFLFFSFVAPTFIPVSGCWVQTQVKFSSESFLLRSSLLDSLELLLLNRASLIFLCLQSRREWIFRVSKWWWVIKAQIETILSHFSTLGREISNEIREGKGEAVQERLHQEDEAGIEEHVVLQTNRDRREFFLSKRCFSCVCVSCLFHASLQCWMKQGINSRMSHVASNWHSVWVLGRRHTKGNRNRHHVHWQHKRSSFMSWGTTYSLFLPMMSASSILRNQKVQKAYRLLVTKHL